MEIACKKIPFPELKRMTLEGDYSPIRDIWKAVLREEVKKDFMAEFHLLEFVLDGEDFANDMRTAKITYSKIPLYN